jgi:hypothetical protein
LIVDLNVDLNVSLNVGGSVLGWSCHASWLTTRGAPLKSEEAFLSCSSVAMMATVPKKKRAFPF